MRVPRRVTSKYGPPNDAVPKLKKSTPTYVFLFVFLFSVFSM